MLHASPLQWLYIACDITCLRVKSLLEARLFISVKGDK